MKELSKEELLRWLMIALIVLAGAAAFALFYYRILPALGYITDFFGILIFPFAIAWLVAVITRPLVAFLVQKLHFPRSLAVLMVLLLLAALVTLVVMLVISMVSDLLLTLSYYSTELNQYTGNLMVYAQNLFERLELDVGPLQQYLDIVKENISSWASKALGVLFSVAKGTPAAFLVILISIVAIFYWCRDEQKIKSVIAGFFPKKHRQSVLGTYESFSTVIGGYVRAQILLVTISIVICMTGFTLIGAESPLAMGLLTGVFDVIPVLGPGTLIIPWSVWNFVSGNTGMGIGLLVVYAMTTSTRYILEPKLVGDRIGLHPLAALAAIFIGMEIFGVVGLIIGPICLAVLMAYLAERRQRKAAEKEAAEREWQEQEQITPPIVEENPKIKQ